ncbi:MAG TPA: hypothetical protein VE221_06315 [Sphingomicrobium sp.]|nr:hypothetical protein [Sphingomicrobium sp.]
MNEVYEKERREEQESESERRSAGPQTQAWDVDVDVYLYSIDPLQFYVDSYLQSNPGSDDIVFFNRNHPGFNVRFHLHDETGQGYTFPSPSRREDGLWSLLGTTCPTTAAYEVFEKHSIDVRDQGLMLVAFNPNSGTAVGQFQYTLNVSTTGAAPYCHLDPGGNNMNGNGVRN